MYSRSRLGLSIALLMVLGMIGGLMHVEPVSAAGTTYYVSQAAGASDNLPNDGKTLAGAFRTIQKCAGVMQEGDTCLVYKGIYRETIKPANNGSGTNPITIKAAPGENVVVSGTDPLNGAWTSAGIAGYPNIYKTPYTRSSLITDDQNQFFIVPKDANGNMTTPATPLWEARWPNITAYNLPGLKNGMAFVQSATRTETAPDAQGKTTVINHKIVDDKLPNINWSGATIWERGGDGYTGQTSKVTGFDNATHTLTFDPVINDQTYYYPVKGTTYYLTGVLAALDMAKEWYVDANYLYLWSPDNLVPANVEYKSRLTAFDLRGKSYINITGIKTFAANILMAALGSNPSNHNVLDTITAEYLYFSDSTHGTSIDHQRENGINMAGDYNEIKNSTVAYSSGALINITGNNNSIVNNSIHDGSYMASNDPLIKLSSGISNLISHNEIRDSGRFNIYMTQGNAEISYNDIYWGMRLSRDGGLIYSWGTDMGNSEIHHNWIHDSKGDDMSVGLYFDNYTENVVVHHNVIYNNDAGIQMGAPGNFKLIYNNTIVNNDYSIGFHAGPVDYKDDFYGTRVFNNILTDKAFSLDGERKLFPVSANPQDSVVQGYNTVSGAGVKFVNPKGNNGNDFRLTSGSAAIDAGALIPGVTDGYYGTAPDAGAYEYLGSGSSGNWIPSFNHSNPPISVLSPPIDTPYENRIKNSGFGWGIGTANNWTEWTPSTFTPTATTVNNEYQYAPPGSPPPTSKTWLDRGKSNKLRLGDGNSDAAGNDPARPTTGDGVEQSIVGLKPNTGYKFVAWVYNEDKETIQLGVENYYVATTPPNISVSLTDNKYVRKEINFTTGSLTASDGTVIKPRVQLYKNKSYANHFSYADDVGLFETAAFDSGLNDSGKLKEVKFSTQTSTSSVGATGNLTLLGTLQNGANADLSTATFSYSSSDSTIVRIDCATCAVAPYTATGAGQATITATATMGGITKAVYHVITVYPVGTPAATEFMAKSYGANANGFVTLNNGTYTLVGKGDNVWFDADDFVYLNKSIPNSNAPGSKITLKATIEFSSVDPASIGLMFREKDAANSNHVELRLDGVGHMVRFVQRDLANPGSQLIPGPKINVPQITEAAGELPRKLPLMLIKEGNAVKGYYLDGNNYILFAETTVNFTGTDLLAGVALYSGIGSTGTRIPEAKAIITNLTVVSNQ